MAVNAFEGNKGETKTMLPVIKEFMATHHLTDVTVVADAGMISADNKKNLEAEGLSFILAVKELDTLTAPGLSGQVADDGRLDLEVPRSTVAPVLGLLAQAHAQDIVCTPATLEDLFLRHYEVAAR